ncbi:MAG TPA: DNA-binding transcriptional regulator [Anaerohalosphaeraceae bacterium]|nr:DNA-binding transcriptional regulator [Phycisphaerae bacterium]HOL32792.1 DNA-binding transcriptional regulator [Anaerohalosphaeraceae bacterium]HOM77497.1 DNA-binding transcriptional regulator [Anaerohalosphaeraceae bacterium]HRS72827.1 DNA-binding transcriptional regulator [Anaerohalosphaeraceae bacterium]HRV21375.1 DNA-binding transcriptional regulator [Anaerohalosphaeraceae bacterium]
MHSRQKIKIAVAHNNISHNTQGIMAGITDFIRTKGDWQLIIWPDSSLESLEFLKQRGCKGAFVSVQTSTKAQQLLSLGIPIIAVSTLQTMLNLPFISADSEQIAKMAYDYFVDKKFANFAFFGLTEAHWSRQRMEHFSRLAAADGGTVHVYTGPPALITSDITSFARLLLRSELNKSQQELLDWLVQLPKPVAVLASCDLLACHLMIAASDAGLSIPDDIAVLGVDNDEALCNLCDPPLSSIAFNFKKAGCDAAQLLDRLISGQDTMRGQRICILPSEIKSRGSTDIYAISDPDIIKALQYIRANRTQPMQVEDIGRHICISKRSLQLKFQKTLNRSIHDEIVRAHFEVAKALLIETDLPIDEIAVRSGFHYTSNLRRVFVKITGMLPHLYRQLHRPR